MTKAENQRLRNVQERLQDAKVALLCIFAYIPEQKKRSLQALGRVFYDELVPKATVPCRFDVVAGRVWSVLKDLVNRLKFASHNRVMRALEHFLYRKNGRYAVAYRCCSRGDCNRRIVVYWADGHRITIQLASRVVVSRENARPKLFEVSVLQLTDSENK